MKYKLDSLSPNILTDDMESSLHFYQKVLGFEKIMAVPEDALPVWVMLQRNGVSFMLQSRQSLAEELPGFAEIENGGALIFYFRVNSLDELMQNIEANGFSLFKKPYTTFYGAREFIVRDPNNFLLVFAEPVE